MDLKLGMIEVSEHKAYGWNFGLSWTILLHCAIGQYLIYT